MPKRLSIGLGGLYVWATGVEAHADNEKLGSSRPQIRKLENQFMCAYSGHMYGRSHVYVALYQVGRHGFFKEQSMRICLYPFTWLGLTDAYLPVWFLHLVFKQHNNTQRTHESVQQLEEQLSMGVKWRQGMYHTYTHTHTHTHTHKDPAHTYPCCTDNSVSKKN